MDNPVNQVTSAAKSAFTVKNILILIFGLLGVFAIAELLGLTEWLVKPIESSKNKWFKKAASVLIVFATAAAATATNGLYL